MNKTVAEKNNRLLTDEEKKSRGFDTASFAKRMQERLAKVRGLSDNGTDDFLRRHHYQQFSLENA